MFTTPAGQRALNPLPSSPPDSTGTPVAAPLRWQQTQQYAQQHPTATTGTGPGGVADGGTSAPTGPTADQNNALTYVRGVLAQYGLPATLADWAWSEIVKGANGDQVILDLQNRPEFKAAFPEIQTQQAKGLAPMSPGDIINYRTKARQYMQEAGLPQGFWDSPSDFATLIGNEVSLDELQHRVQLAQQATYQVPQAVRDTLARDYGMDDGHLTAAFLDPNQADPILTKRFLAAQIGGQAKLTGYGDTSRAQNEYLAGLGVDAAHAQAGFNQLAASRELFGSLPGEHTTGITADQQLAATFAGDADAQRAIAQRQQQRKAAFDAGGQFAGSQGGFSGVGAAQGA